MQAWLEKGWEFRAEGLGFRTPSLKVGIPTMSKVYGFRVESLQRSGGVGHVVCSVALVFTASSWFLCGPCVVHLLALRALLPKGFRTW